MRIWPFIEKQEWIQIVITNYIRSNQENLNKRIV